MLCCAVAVSACSASATVKNQTPIANLQPYRTVVVRVAATEGQRWTQLLEDSVVTKIANKCKFDRVLPSRLAAGQPADLILDVNIQRSFRGGDGVIQNENQAVMDVLVVLSDGISDDLVGTVWIRGKSPAVRVAGSEPENEAIGAVAGSVAKVMDISGCGLPRVARVEPNPEPTPPPPADADTEAIARGEQLNNEGKTLFRAADVQGAAAKFHEAIAAYPDPRYYFNLCFAYESLKRYDDAITTCKQVLELNPDERLVEKTNERIQIIGQKKAAN
jgi:hypothetical protein